MNYQYNKCFLLPVGFMKVVFYLLCCFALFGCEQQKQLPPINYEGIKFLTLGSMSEEDVRNMAKGQLEGIPFAEYQVIKSDESLFNQRIQAIVDELKNQQLASSTEFSFQTNVFIGQLNTSEQTVDLSFPFKSGQLIFRPLKAGGIFPQFIHVLLANTDDIAKLSARDFSALDKSFKNTKAIYSIEIVKAQHHKFLQAVITQVDVYQGKNHDQLVYQFRENRKAVDVINNRLLSEGYSLDLTPVHSFNFFGRRILDPLYDLGFHNEACKKSEKLLGHQVINCHYIHFANDQGSVYFDVKVVGGKMVEIQLNATGKLSTAKQQQVMQRVITDLKLKPAILSGNYSSLVSDPRVKKVKKKNHKSSTGKVLSWEYFGVVVEYDSEALLQDNDEVRTVINLTGKTWLEYLKNKQNQVAN